MEELKLLVESIAGLPDLAIWVVAMYFTFKLAIVGSIYGVIRFVALKLHDWAITKKTTIVEEVTKVEVKHSNITLDSKLISTLKGEPEQMYRLFDRMKRNGLSYIFEDDITRVHRALDMLESSEKENK